MERVHAARELDVVVAVRERLVGPAKHENRWGKNEEIEEKRRERKGKTTKGKHEKRRREVRWEGRWEGSKKRINQKMAVKRGIVRIMTISEMKWWAEQINLIEHTNENKCKQVGMKIWLNTWPDEQILRSDIQFTRVHSSRIFSPTSPMTFVWIQIYG